MQDPISVTLVVLAIFVIVTFTVLSLVYPTERAATEALSKRCGSKVPDEYKCKQCGAIEDQKHIFLRSSGYCSLACEDPLSVICDKPDYDTAAYANKVIEDDIPF